MSVSNVQYSLVTPGTAGTLVHKFGVGEEDRLLAHLRFYLTHKGKVSLRVETVTPKVHPEGPYILWRAPHVN